MKKMKIFILILMLGVMSVLTACSNEKVKVDSNGLATWEAVKDAVEYEYCFVDANYITEKSFITSETSVQIPEGYCVHVRAILENGETGDWMVSEFFGEPHSAIEREDADLEWGAYVDNSFDVKWKDLQTYEVIANMNQDSIKTLEDGNVYFEAAAPNGGVMRFLGTGVSVSDGTIAFEPGGKIAALDAIGRICAVEPAVSNAGDDMNLIEFTGGYTFTEATSVDALEELFFIWGFGCGTIHSPEGDTVRMSHMEYQPNFIAFGANKGNTDAFSISELTVYYDELTYHTGIRMFALEMGMYGSYIEGEYYKPEKEVYDSANNIFDFYLLALPDVANERELFYPDPLNDFMIDRCILDIDDSRYTIGDLKDAAGNVLDKNNAVLFPGSTLEITLNDYTLDLQLPVLERCKNVSTLHELTPYNNAKASGEVSPLVVPIVWQDQQECATDELLNAFRNELGRVVDANGNVTDYSENLTDGFSLSKYYDIASYDNYQISSYLTEWYYAPYNFSEMKYTDPKVGDFQSELYKWLYQTYPDMDWIRFDGDEDGFFDLVILLSTGAADDDGFMIMSYAGAAHYSMGYTGEGAGTPDEPAIKNYVVMHTDFLDDNTLIHEYAHNFGLVDYYDVSYSGIDAVGSYDMQSSSKGDWNPYSKYAVGWIEPVVIQGLNSGESMEVTIGSFANTGDAIVIPAAGTEHDGPFGEYIMVDLFTDDGVNQYDAAEFGIGDAVGVRMYHINAAMEKRVLKSADGIEYPIGTVHYTNAHNADGTYLIELLQAGGQNTFTNFDNLRTKLSKKDFFKAGDVFTAEKYSEFLTNGRMDDGSEFGYSVEVVSIDRDAAGEYNAVIRITRK